MPSRPGSGSFAALSYLHSAANVLASAAPADIADGEDTGGAEFSLEAARAVAQAVARSLAGPLRDGGALRARDQPS